MKRSDYAMIILIASVSILVSYFVASALFGDIKETSEKVQTVEKIDSKIDDPDTAVFNEKAINPTVQTYIGTQAQQRPAGQ